MSLILCLEDSAGQDTELEVDEGDDFATFLQKAKDILGYEVDLASITGDKEVNLTDNIYQFLVANEVEGEDSEEEAVPELPKPREDIFSSFKQPESSKDSEERIDLEDAVKEFDTLEEKLKQLEDDVKSTKFETKTGKTKNEIKTEEPGEIKEELEEVEDVEYLMEDTEEEELLNTVEGTLKPADDPEEFAEIEYLEDEDNDAQDDDDVMNVEMLDSEMEDDIMQDMSMNVMIKELKDTAQQRNKDKKVSFSEMVGLNKSLETDKSLMSSLNDEETLTVKTEGKQYTRKQLLDILEDSVHEDSEGEDTDLATKQKLANRGKRKADSYDKKMMKDLFYSTPIQPNNKMRRVSFDLDAKKVRDISKMSRAEMEYLKSTVRQPIIEVINMTLMDINLCMGSIDEIKKFTERDGEFISSCRNKSIISSDDWKYLPTNYEDVDNDGIYDYLDRDETNFDPNDDGLLAVINEKPPSKKIQKQNKEDVALAVGGIHRMLGASTPVPRKRGRPRKYENGVSAPKPKKVQPAPVNDYDTFEEIKKDSLDLDDDDYVPGKHVDWTKNRQKGKSIGFYCRMCGAFMSKLGQVNSHALSHRLPGRAVFPCILCPYGYTTYSELCKHVREEHDPKKMAVPKNVASQGKVMPGALLTPKNKRGRPPKKLSEEKQREQDDALVGRIITNYTEASLKPPKGNYVTKKYHPNNSNALLGKVIQPHFKIQPNFGNNDDSEDVEDVDMLEEWLDDEEELYIMEMTQNANAAIKEEIEAENSSDRSRMMSADARQAQRRLMGKRGEENVFKVEGDTVNTTDDILQRIRAELLMDKNDFEIKQLNVSKVVGEDYGKSIENDRLAFMSSIKSVRSKVNANSNNGIGKMIDQTIIKIEPSKSLLKIASDVKDIKSEFTIQYIREKENNTAKETKVGKSIMDIACEGISELVDPSFSGENIVDMPMLDIGIEDPKIDIKMIKSEVFNLDDAIMESKQYDPSILSIDDNPQEFGQEENTAAEVSLCIDGETDNVNDLDAHMELGEIPIDGGEAGEICGQNHDELDKLVNVEAEKITQVHCVISDMPKLDDSEGILDAEDDYQAASEPVDVNSTIQILDTENCDAIHFKMEDSECQENIEDICHESAKIVTDIEDDEALFDNDCKLKPDDIDASIINRDLDDSQNIDQISDEQPLEVEKDLDEETESDLVNVVSDTCIVEEDNNDQIDNVDEPVKEAVVDCSEICYKSDDVDTILDDDDMVIEDVSNGHVQREIVEQEVNEDVENVSVTADAAILSIEEDEDKIEYNDFAEVSKDIDNREEITDEKQTEDVSLDADLSKVGSISGLNIDDEKVSEEDCLNNEDQEEPKNDDVVDVDENSHQLEDEMSKLHGDPISIEDDEKIDNSDEANKNFEITEDLDSSIPDSGEISSAKDDIPASKPEDIDLSSDDEVVMMDYDDSLKDNNDSVEIPEKADDKSLEESPSKPDRGDISSDDDVVMMDYDDFSSEAGLENSDKSKIENSTYEVVKTHESHFSELSPKSNLHDSEDEDVSIGLESQVIEGSPTKLNDSHISINDEEDRIDYEDFSSEPNFRSVSDAKNECDAADKPEDSAVLIESDDSIDLSETNLSDRNV